MSNRVFLINVEPPEIRVAEIRGGQLFDLDIERDSRMLGNIYKGRVENVLPGMDAAFVDIGHKRNGLLYVGDVAPDGVKNASITDLVKSNQEFVVQVARPPVGAKGARVTTRLSLPGRYSILISNSETTGVSKRIESEEERQRLRRIADKLRPLDHGLILRTEAEGMPEHLIAEDVHLLAGLMMGIRERAASTKAPALIHQDLGLLGRLARDRMSDDVTEIHIDSFETMERLRDLLRGFAPQLVDRLRHYHDSTSIFERFGISEKVTQATQRVVPLGSGGFLAIDEAEALTAIDVNTGSFVGKRGLSDTVLKTNLEAVEEISRQLRLRDIGGIIVVDFIDMERTRDRVRVFNSMEAALKDDRAKTRIVQISPSGLVEMTRRREDQSLRIVLHEPCPYCSGLGYVPRGETIAIEARRRVREMALKNQNTGILVVLQPETAVQFLGEEAEWVRDLELVTNVKITVRVDSSYERDQVNFERILPDIALKRDLVAGSLVPIGADTALVPEKDPIYAVVASTLIHLDKLPEKAAALEKGDAALIEIVEAGRHFAIGRSVNSKH